MYRERPRQVTRTAWSGWRASGVPGTVRGLELAHQKYGHKPWAELIEPAVKLAAGGFPVSYSLAESLQNDEQASCSRSFPNPSGFFWACNTAISWCSRNWPPR